MDAGCICSAPSTAPGRRSISSYRKPGTAKPPSSSWPWQTRTSGRRGFLPGTELRSYPAAIRELQKEGHLHHRCRRRTRRYCNNRIDSDHRAVKRRLRAMQGPTNYAENLSTLPGMVCAPKLEHFLIDSSGHEPLPCSPGDAQLAWSETHCCYIGAGLILRWRHVPASKATLRRRRTSAFAWSQVRILSSRYRPGLVPGRYGAVVSVAGGLARC